MEEQGIVTRTVGGLCFVYSEFIDHEIQAYMRGKLKQKVDRIIPGDRVIYRKEGPEEAVIEDVLPRETELIRPRIANARQAVIVMSCDHPPFQPQLLDRIIVQVEASGLEPVVCINKADLCSEEKIERMKDIYQQAGFEVLVTSAKNGLGLECFRKILVDWISVLAGPSGVGKSSLLNALNPEWNLKMGDVSKKLKRGKHTTRHSQLLLLPEGGLVADTPGFAVLNFEGIEVEDLSSYFRDFAKYISQCKFQDCLHDKEPGCAVKKAVEDGNIADSRYKSYLDFLQDLKERRNNIYG